MPAIMNIKRAVFISYAAQAFKIIDGQITGALRDFKEHTEMLAKENCPVLTGNLKSSIKTQIIKQGGMAGFSIFTQTGYGAPVELGGAKRAANPFVFSAIQQASKDFEDDLEVSGKRL